MSLHYFSEDTSFNLSNTSFYSHWLIEVIDQFSSKRLKNINYIFCSDEYLLTINQTHLQHDYYTDIITFDQSENVDELEADVFISIDRVKENAQTNRISFKQELSRVMAHGLLHLLGFNDKTEEEKRVMREKEDACLSLQKE